MWFYGAFGYFGIMKFAIAPLKWFIILNHTFNSKENVAIYTFCVTLRYKNSIMAQNEMKSFTHVLNVGYIQCVPWHDDLSIWHPT